MMRLLCPAGLGLRILIAVIARLLQLGVAWDRLHSLQEKSSVVGWPEEENGKLVRQKIVCSLRKNGIG